MVRATITFTRVAHTVSTPTQVRPDFHKDARLIKAQVGCTREHRVRVERVPIHELVVGNIVGRACSVDSWDMVRLSRRQGLATSESALKNMTCVCSAVLFIAVDEGSSQPARTAVNDDPSLRSRPRKGCAGHSRTPVLLEE